MLQRLFIKKMPLQSFADIRRDLQTFAEIFHSFQILLFTVKVERKKIMSDGLRRITTDSDG